MHAQPGIFALGTTDHCYLELDLTPGTEPAELARRLAALSGPQTTIAGLNVVIGFRPELWAAIAPESAPDGVTSFEAIDGDGFTMPATQHDAWLWVAGGARDVVFDAAIDIIGALAGVAHVASELGGWLYQHRRDLTGFIDGTENPAMLEAPEVAAADQGPGAGASVLLFQKWQHLPSWRGLSVAEQERVIGRSKPDSIEMPDDVKPKDSHVARNVVEEGGEELAIYRRNVAYGSVTDHGTVFVGFCATQHPLDIMLRRMAGQEATSTPEEPAVRDALTRYTVPLSGAYYVCPAIDALAGLLPPDEED